MRFDEAIADLHNSTRSVECDVDHVCNSVLAVTDLREATEARERSAKTNAFTAVVGKR